MLMRNMNGKEPPLRTLSKYAKVVRTEHCFLLFEELGKSDKWLHCLEVCFYTGDFFRQFKVLGLSDFLFFCIGWLL